MTIFTCILLGFLIVCAIAASLSKSLLNSILIFMSYSLIMSVIWILLESPDLAVTEAADDCSFPGYFEEDPCHYEKGRRGGKA